MSVSLNTNYSSITKPENKQTAQDAKERAAGSNSSPRNNSGSVKDSATLTANNRSVQEGNNTQALQAVTSELSLEQAAEKLDQTIQAILEQPGKSIKIQANQQADAAARLLSNA